MVVWGGGGKKIVGKVWNSKHGEVPASNTNVPRYAVLLLLLLLLLFKESHSVL